MSTSDRRIAAFKKLMLVIVGLGIVIGLGWALLSGDAEPVDADGQVIEEVDAE